ncbi:hypothetical protein [Streptomyces avermitilis]|uniref:hypothetical protein n=1 Tax=Streptomyces avermitilis TaxID=33903 RepID=UPI00371136C2
MGAGLKRTDTVYGLLLAFDNHNGDDFTAVVGDLEYVRLLTEASGVVVPADKVTHVLRPLKGE